MMPRMKRFARKLGSLLAGLILLLSFVACSGEKSPANGIPVLDKAGHDRILAETKGKPLFLSFWTTWCPGCREEVPALNRLQAEYGDKIRVIAISLDEKPEAVNKFFGDQKPSLEVVMGSEDLAAFYQVSAIPQLIVYDAAGKLVINQAAVFPDAMLKMIADKLVAGEE